MAYVRDNHEPLMKKKGKREINQVIEEPGVSAQCVVQETGYAHETVRRELRAVGLHSYQLKLLGCTNFGLRCILIGNIRKSKFSFAQIWRRGAEELK